MLVRGIAAEVCEWQNDDRQSRGRNWCGSLPDGAFSWTDGVSPGRATNILQTELAQIDEICVDLASNLLVRGRRNANAARLSNTLKPRRNIDAIAEDVVGIDNDVANIDPDSVPELRVGCTCCALRHSPLNCNRASHGIDGTCELDQHAVAGRLDNPAFALSDFGIDEFAPYSL